MANNTRGSARQGWSSVADDGYLDIRPPAATETDAEEWRILAIHAPVDAAIEVYRTDGANQEKIEENEGGLANYQWVVTRDIYLRVKNVSGSSRYLGYDAFVSMEES